MHESVTEKAATQPRNLDNTLERLGKWGRFQLIQGFLLDICLVPVGFHLLNIVFIAQPMDYKCNSSNFSSSNSSVGDGSVDLGTCTVTKFNSTTNTTSSEGCTDWTYSRDKYLSLTSEWNLVCDNAVLARLPQSLFIVGQGIGAVVFATASDKYGRRPAVLVTLVLTAGAGLGLAFSPNIIVFCVLRLFNGIFQQGIVVTSTTLLMETFMTSQRVIVSTSRNLTWSITTVMLALVAYLLRYTSWRTSQLVFTSASLISIFHIIFLAESLRWLVVNQKVKQATKWIHKAAQINKADIFDSNLVSSQEEKELDLKKTETASDTSDEEHSYKYTCLDIFRNKFLLKMSVVVWFSWWVDSLTYFSLYLTSSSLADDMYLNFFLNSLAEVPAGPLFLIFAKRYGRRKFFMGMHAVSGVCLLTATGVRVATGTDNNAAVVAATALAFLGKVGNTCCFNNMFVYVPEIYPTNMRTIGMGSGSTANRVGGAIAPFVQILADVAPWAPGTIFGVACLITAALNTMLPEAEGQELPQCIADIKGWGKKPKREMYNEMSLTKQKQVI